MGAGLRLWYDSRMRIRDKESTAQYNRQWYAARKADDPDFARRRSIGQRYGITLEDYDSRLAVQGGLCAVCQGITAQMHLDHNHTTGALRSFLCSNCNRALGYAMDSPARLRALAEYLEAHDESS